jgi:hypothetical protein
MLNDISSELFKNITEEILFIESHMINSEYIGNIEEKHFRLYKPGSEFYNYIIETEEQNNFTSGLFTLPIKPYYVDSDGDIILNDRDILNNINYPTNIDILKPILNSFKYKYIKKENKNKNHFPYIVNNIGENIDSNNLFYNSYYYTLHGNYLNRLKHNYKNTNYSNNINEYMHSLTNYINSKKINNSRSVDLLDIISFLENERNNFYKGKPIILIIYACSLKENYEYKQNEILNKKFNRYTFYNYNYHNNNNNNALLSNQNTNINKNITNFIRSILTIFNIIDTNLSSLNNIDKINSRKT